ncbi:MAG: hypothetical protein QNI96_14570 [Woeseiaceae bacterium]|nr:hypothetical protein [Woeseiaceae bacterium]
MSTDPKKKSGPDAAVPMPDIYSEEYAVDESFIEDTEFENVIAETSSGFDPYDTAVLYKKQR